VYEVRNAERELGLLYIDPFQRPGKRQGAYMTDLSSGRMKNGRWMPAVVLNVLNYEAPDAGGDGTIDPGQVTTIFHELGHGLHSLLSKVPYDRIGGTNVARDFVELPSTLMEAWAFRPEVLATYARHRETGEVITPQQVAKLRSGLRFQQATMLMRTLFLSRLDLMWHTAEADGLTTEQAMIWERELRQRFEIAPIDEDERMSPAFQHIWAGGYAVGYYSYLWSQALAADAYEAFLEAEDIAVVARRFREEILERGDSADPAVLFERFRGRPFDFGALKRIKTRELQDPD
jgi:peptidyl-dipeptidase Dcp